MKYFIIKYSLSNERIDEAECDHEDGSPYAYQRMAGYSPMQFKIDRDAFEDRAEAVKAAEKMRERKIASLKKSIQKIESIKF